MFEIDQEQFTLEELKQAAKKFNMDFVKYMEKMKAKGLKEVKKSTDINSDVTGDSTIKPPVTRTSTRTDVRKRDLEKIKEEKNTFESSDFNDISFIDDKYKKPKKSDTWRSFQRKIKELKKQNDLEGVKLTDNRDLMSEEEYKNQQKELNNELTRNINSLRSTIDISDTDDQLLTYDDALNNLIKDPSQVDGEWTTDIEGNEVFVPKYHNRYDRFLKEIPKIFNYNYDPHEGDERRIDIEDNILAKVIDIATDKQLQQLAKNRMSLENKEALLTEARLTVIKEEQTLLEDEITSITEELSWLSGGDMKMDNLDSPNRIESFNKLVEKRNKLATTFQQLQGQYGLDLAAGIIKNNFKGTEELKKFNERYSSPGEKESLTFDLLSRFESGVVNTVMKMNPFTLGSTAVGMLGSEITNLISGSDDYNMFDEFTDVLYNVADFNSSGRGKQEKFEWGGGPETYARLAMDMLPFTLGIIAEAKRGNITGLKKIIGNTIGGKAGRLNGLSSKLKNQILVADAAFKVTALDNVEEAKTLGLEGGSAKAYAFIKSLGTAVTSAKIGIEGRIAAPIFTKATLATFANTLKGAATVGAMRTATTNFLKTTGGELLQEETEVIIDLGVKSAFALALPGYENSVQQQKELIAGTLMLSGGFGGARTITDFKINKKQLYADVIKQSNDLLESFDVLLKATKDTKSKEQLKKAKQFTIDIIRAAKISPENVTPEQLELLVEKQELLRQKENTDSAFHVELNNKIKEIDEKINQGQVVKGKEKVEQKIIKGVEKYGEKLSTSVDRLSQQEVDDFIDKLDDKQKKRFKKSKAGEQLGFFYKKEDGTRGFVINTDVAASEGNITTDAHEMVHAILDETVENNPEAAKSLGKALTEELAKIDFNNITDSEFSKRLSSYLKDADDGKISEANAWEEALTLFSEAALTGDIVYDESVLSKIKDVINRVLKNVGIQKEFNTGRDVYNFIKDYNKSLLKGKVDKRIVKGAKKGFKGKLVEKPKVKSTDKTKVKLSKVESDKIDTLVGPKIDGKYTVTKAEWNAGKADQVIGNLYEGLQGLIKSKIPSEKPPGFSQDDFVSGTIAELIPHIRNFNPEKNNSLSGWINSQLQNKIGNVFKKGEAATKDVFEVDVSEAKGVAVEGTFTPTEEKSIRSKLRRDLKIDKGLIDKVKQAVRKTFGTKLPEIESKEFKQALQKAYRTELKTPLAELLGTRENYKKFLEDNFESIYKALPQDILNKRFRQFAEDTGQREKTPEGKKIFKKRSIDKQEFVDYFLGPDVGTSTKGTRKDALAETLGEIMALDATMEVIKEPEVKAKREAVAKLQDQKVTKTDEAKIALTLNVNPSLKFSKKVVDDTSVLFQKLFGAPLVKKLKELGIGQVLNPNNKNDIDYYGNTLVDIFSQYLPIEFMNAAGFASVNKTDKAKVLARGQYFTGKAFDLIKERYKKNERSFTDRERKIVNAATKISSFTQIKNGKLVLKDFKSPEYKQYIKDNFDGAEYIFFQLQEMMFNHPETIPAVAAFFNTASSSSNHLIRQIGVARGTDENYLKFEKEKIKIRDKYNKGEITKEERNKLLEKFKTVKEHVWQQNQAGEYIFNMMVNRRVKTPGYFEFVRNNFFMLGLTSYNDNKLKDIQGIYGEPYNYGNSMTPEFTDALNEAVKTGDFSKALPSLIRYFDSLVNNNGGGFNSNVLTFNGNPLSEVYKVIVSPKLRNTETQDFQNQLIREQLLGEQVDSQKEINEFLNIAPSKETAAVKNNNSLPTVVKFSKSQEYTNNNVLDKMAELDKEQSEAQMKFSKSQNLSDDFNKILENKTGIGAEKIYSDIKAQVVGANKGNFNFFVPPSAEDFVGLLYKTLGKGKLGDAQMAWYKKNLLDPFSRAMDNISRDRIALMNDFKALKKDLKIVPKNLKKKLPGEPFTQEQAVRTYIWNKQGMTPEGLSKTDLKELTDFVESKPELVLFADQLIALQKGDKYPAPKFGWLAGNITTDLMDGINTIKRAKYLEQWQYNVDDIFTKANLNKLEAAYGKSYRDALESMLKRMRTGRNREFNSDTLTGRVTDWLTNSIGAIMFFNTRSAVLQTISAFNFINFKDNNIFAAGKAFANQPQFWKDFITLFNSDFLLDRRNGLKLNVNESDIADMAKKGGVRGVISEMLRLGFLPTQIADSFAISSGGATFYRNRIKSLQKQGMSKEEAEQKAFEDFRETAEESQQSSRPDRISQQQAGPLGRVILAFANTPMQYTRLIKKAASDLKNGRGDTMTNISKIFYYGFVQNLLFNAMQQALFAIGFGDEEEETEKRQEKYVNIVNSMSDSILRGMGIGGAVFSVIKNTAIKLSKESDKKSPKFQDVLTKELTQISPPVSSKLNKLRAAGRSYSWNKKEMMEKGFSLDNPAYLAAGQVIAATTNIPLDRAFKKIDNIRKASSSDYEAWARIAMMAGWSDWELGVKKEKSKIKKKSKKYIRIPYKSNKN